MADVRCPMCGKANPEGRAECMYCGSRLKPLMAAEQPQAEPPRPVEPARPQSGDDATLIRGALRGRWQSQADDEPEAEEETEEAEDEAAEQDASPSWLTRLRTQTGAGGTPTVARSAARHSPPPSEPEPEVPEPEEPEPAEPEPPEPEPAPPPPPPAASRTERLSDRTLTSGGTGRRRETGDLLRNLRAASRRGVEPEPPPKEEPPPSADVPDWLNSLRKQSLAPVEPEPPPVDTEAGMDDWLRSLREQSTEPPSADEAPAAEPEPPAVPDWMIPAPSQPAAPMAADDFPEWLSTLGPPAAEPVSPPMEDASEGGVPSGPSGGASVPDWLRSLGAAESAHEAAPEPTAAEPAEDLPDWLRSLDQAAAAPAPAAQSPALGDAGLPDWLDSLPPSQFSPPDAAAPAEDMPEWLASLTASAPPEAALPASPFIGGADAPAAEAREEEPGWLAAMRPSEAEPEPPPQAAGAGEEEPDWLAAMRSSGAAPDSPAQAAEAGEEEPGWLAAMRPTEAEPEPPMQAAGAGEEAPGELPDWLAAMRSSEPAPDATLPGRIPVAPPEPAEPTLIRGADKPPAPAIMPGAAPSDLERATLPAWLEAMRPMPPAGASASASAEYEETTGPLAGMRGVIAAEPAIALPTVRLAAAIPPAVNETHAAQARLIQALIKEETMARAAPRKVGGRTIVALFERWLVFAILAVAVVAPFVLDAPLALFAPPSLYAVETVAARDTIAIAPADRPVLVAFEYDPGAAGEMDLLAGALLDHLAARGLPVVAVTTRPLAPGLAQAALDRALPPAEGEAAHERAVNLGYLPGGAMALPAFVLDPRGQVSSEFTSEIPDPEAPPLSVWQGPVLIGVRSLSDFGAVAVIGNSPEAVRAWIEQIAFYRRGVSGPLHPPLIALVSAAAEPMVQPYFLAENAEGSLQGLVSGQLGAAGYEELAGTAQADEVMDQRRDAQGLGLLTAVVIIAAGGLLFGSFGLLRRMGERQS